MSFGLPKYDIPKNVRWEPPAPKKVAITTSDYRPCSVDGIKAIFHRWAEKSWVVPPSPLVGGHSGGTVRGVFAIVEMEDGTVREVEPTQIKFDTTDRRFETLRRHCLGQFEDE